jgi:molecular chaperone Hsp33
MSSDHLINFYTNQGVSRGCLVRLDQQTRDIIERHNYHEVINRYISELICVAACLSRDIKNEGIVTIQMVGSLAIKMIVVDMNADGSIRACAKYDQALIDLQKNIFELFGNDGRIIITVDLYGDKKSENQRYQAIVEITGMTIAESMSHFFKQSQQIPTVFIINSCKQNYENSYLASCLCLQKMPLSNISDRDIQEDEWVTDLALISTATAKEMLDKNLSSQDLIYRLFNQRNVSVTPEKKIVFKCNCSFEKISKILDSFSQKDIEEMTVNGAIELICEFCNQKYIKKII